MLDDGADRDPSAARRPPDGPPPGILRWALQIGIAGFLAGFAGPIIVTPEANQGPLLGIFISGPLALGLGLFLGVLSKGMGDARPSSLRRALHVTTGVVVATVLAILLFAEM